MVKIIEIDFGSGQVVDRYKLEDPETGQALGEEPPEQDPLREASFSVRTAITAAQQYLHEIPEPDNETISQEAGTFQLLRAASRAPSKRNEIGRLSLSWRPWHYLAAAMLDGKGVFFSSVPSDVKAAIAHAAAIEAEEGCTHNWQDTYMKSLERRLHNALLHYGRADLLPLPSHYDLPEAANVTARRLRAFLQATLDQQYPDDYDVETASTPRPSDDFPPADNLDQLIRLSLGREARVVGASTSPRPTGPLFDPDLIEIFRMEARALLKERLSAQELLRIEAEERVYTCLCLAARTPDNKRQMEMAALSSNWKFWHFLAATILDGEDIFSTQNYTSVKEMIIHAANMYARESAMTDWQEVYIQSLERRLQSELEYRNELDCLPLPSALNDPREVAIAARRLIPFLHLVLSSGW